MSPWHSSGRFGSESKQPEAATSLQDEVEQALPLQSSKQQRALRGYAPLWVWVVCSLFWLAFGLTIGLSLSQQLSKGDCHSHVSVWSPALEAIEYSEIQFQNSFFEKSIYRGKPTPELEKAWADLWGVGNIVIPYDRFPDLNKSVETGYVASADGKGAVGGLDVFHQIHCLDLVRQYTYRDEYDYSDLPAFDGTPKQIRTHVDHCINSLRITLQCFADVTPYMIMLDETKLTGFTPDFNTQHKCRNFDRIREWNLEYAIKD